jgi:hypothetical protein
VDQGVLGVGIARFRRDVSTVPQDCDRVRDGEDLLELVANIEDCDAKAGEATDNGKHCSTSAGVSDEVGSSMTTIRAS